jgi:hypothetical protein
MRFVRVSMAVAVLAALLVQSLVALTTPRAARADVFLRPMDRVGPAATTPRLEPGKPARYVPLEALPKAGKDPRHC